MSYHSYISVLLFQGILCICPFSHGEEAKKDGPIFSTPDGTATYFQRTYMGENAYEYSFLISEQDKPGKLLETPLYHRGADILFSPDGSHIAITWYALCDTSLPVVLKWSHEQGKLSKVKGSKQHIPELDKIFWTAFSQNYQLSGFFSHAYIKALAWLDQDTLLLGGWGHGFSSPRFYLESCWCQLYSLSTGKVSSDLTQFNTRKEPIHERKFPPHQGQNRGNNNLIVQRTGKISTVTMPNGEELKAEGNVGIIYAMLPDKNCREQTFLIQNILQQNRQGTCRLILHTREGKYREAPQSDLSDSFIQAAQWQPGPDDRCTIYSLASIDSNHFIIQGFITNPQNEQTDKATFIFDARTRTFSDNLPELNDTKPRLVSFQ